MPRTALTMLMWTCTFGLSCGLVSAGPATLPPVSAAPPTIAHTRDAAPAAGPAAPAPLVAEIAERIASRRTVAMTPTEIRRVAETIVAESERHGLDPQLVLAVIHVESRYDPSAFSSAGAIGLMQILPTTGAELAAREGVAWEGAKTLFEPVSNVRLGIAYLKELSDRYGGNTSVALAAYNWGPGHIDGRLRRGTPMPTIYPGLVFTAYRGRRS